MAAVDVYERGSKIIHVPPCDHRPCQERLLHLVDRLRLVEVECEFKYTPLGLYVDSFMKFIKAYPCTILHVCPLFYKKLSQALEMKNAMIRMLEAQALDVSNLLKDFGDKIICVRFQQPECSVPHKEGEAACDLFFSNFSINDISNESSAAEFVNQVKIIAQAYTDSVPRTCGYPKEQVYVERLDTGAVADDVQLESPYLVHLHGTSMRQEKYFMEPVSDIFGQTRGQEVFARGDWLQVQRKTFTSIASLDLLENLSLCLKVAKDDTDTKTRQANQYFVLKHVIPELYNTKQAQTLAHIVVRGQAVLQTPAMTMLELLLLEGHATKNRDHLVSIEQMLTDFLDQNSGFPADEQESGLLRKRLSNLLLMLQFEIAIHCHENKNVKKPARSIRTTRTTFKDKIKSQIVSNTTEISQKTSQQLTEVISEFCKLNVVEDPYLQAKKLLDRGKASQVAVVFQHLKEIFSSMNAQSLVRLKEYVKCKRKTPPKECLSMISLGLTLFLCHGLRNASARNIQEISTAVVNVLETATLKDSPHEVNWMLVMLIFDKTPVIRQGIIPYFKMKNIYPSEIETLLLAEITRLLCPFLIVETKKCETTHQMNWGTAGGTFSGVPVIILFHTPQEKDPEIKNETQFFNFLDTKHTNQIKKLLTLQHKFIISMFAYQVTSIPQFYVLEDYMQNNLQLALKNRNDNRRYFDYPTLMRYLSCAIEALEYCHNMKIVHRNLTAASLFIVDDHTVKLGDFILAIDLTNHTELTVVSGSSQIPTRWSAPESLSRLTYSKASDVYMFGHLMYEIHTHGALPYSHLSLKDDVFIEQVTRNAINLCHERCMTKDVYKEMCRCVAFDPGDRPNASSVKETLVNLCKNACREYRPRFPSLSETPAAHERQPSTVFEKGSPEYGKKVLEAQQDISAEHRLKNTALYLGFNPSSTFGLSHQKLHTGPVYVRPVNISTAHGLIQCQMRGGYLFREDVKRKMSQDMLDHLNSFYRGVIPQCMNIHRNDEDSLTFEYYIPSLQVLNILHYVSPLDTYLTAVLKVAENLELLHNASFILGDLSTSSVFVEQHNDMHKVHIVSWAHLNQIQTFSDRSNHLQFSPESPAFARAAPEVAESGLYSPASDVYCFGKLLKDISANLNRSFNHYTNMSINQIGPEQWDHCYDLLMETARQCTISDRRKRLPLVNVMGQIKMIIAHLRPNSAGQGDSTPQRFLPTNDHSRSLSVSLSSRYQGCDSLSTTYDSSLHRQCINSETTVKKLFDSDSDDEVIPKVIFKKRHSKDSGMQSISESNTSIDTRHKTLQVTSSQYVLAKHFVESHANIPDIDIYERVDIADTIADIYVDAVSSPTGTNKVYTNIPKPKILPDDTDIDYSHPAEIPLGYMYTQTRSERNSNHPYKQGETHTDTSEDPDYIDIENSPFPMAEAGSVRGVLQNCHNNAGTEDHGPLPAGALTTSGDEGSFSGFANLPYQYHSYKYLLHVRSKDDSGDTNHSYQSLISRTSDDENEIFV